jgi:hypothetical protein
MVPRQSSISGGKIMNMNSVSGGLIIVSLVLCYFLVAPVSAENPGDSLPSQFISSSTSIAATGEVNESVSLKLITSDGLATEKKEWLSSVSRTGFTSGVWSSNLFVRHDNGAISVNYFRTPFNLEVESPASFPRQQPDISELLQDQPRTSPFESFTPISLF